MGTVLLIAAGAHAAVLDCVRSRVRPSPRSSNHSVSSATPSGSPSNVKVCTMRSGRTSWKQPRNPYSVPPCTETYRQLPPVRASQCSIRVVMASGPAHRANSAGSVWARNSCAGVAAKSRVIRMTGRSGSASMTVSVILFILFSVQFRQDGVQAAVTLLETGPVALDPGVHKVEGLDLEAHRAGLPARRPADETGVLEHAQVLVDGLQRHPVRLGELAHGRVAVRQPGHHVAPGRVREGGEDLGQRVCGHRARGHRTPSFQLSG